MIEAVIALILLTLVGACSGSEAPQAGTPAVDANPGEALGALSSAAPSGEPSGGPGPAAGASGSPATTAPASKPGTKTTASSSSASAVPQPSPPAAGGTGSAAGPVCPVGEPVTEVTYDNALAQAGLGGDLTVWLVVTRGTVTNKSNATIRISEVDLRLVSGSTVELLTAPVKDGEVAPGKTAKWVTTTIVQGGTKPSPTVSINGKWQWKDSYPGCPAG